MSENSELRSFDTYADYRGALLELMGKAKHRLWFCDKTLQESELNSPITYDILWSFFTQSPASEMRILLADPSHLIQHCPRLWRLHASFSHKLTIRHIENPPNLWQQGFVLADEDGYIKRHHFDWPRGEIGEDGRQSAILEHVFDELWERSTPLVSTQHLGL